MKRRCWLPLLALATILAVDLPFSIAIAQGSGAFVSGVRRPGGDAGHAIGIEPFVIRGETAFDRPLSERDRQRVINGVADIRYGHVYAVRYRNALGEEQLCTGTRLDSRHVLTAAHCGCGVPQSYELSNEVDVSRQWRAPIVDRRNGSRRELRLSGAPILFDPSWCRGTGRYGRDLALLKVDRNILPTDQTDEEQRELARDAPGAPLWAFLKETTRPGTHLTVVGYGRTENGSIGRRMRANVPVLTRDCAERIWWRNCAPFAEMILAEAGSSSVQRDTCGGDSGGPVVVDMLMEDPNPDLPPDVRQAINVTALVGVTSRPAPLTQPLAEARCGGGGIYTIVGRTDVFSWFAAQGVKFQTFNPLVRP